MHVLIGTDGSEGAIDAARRGAAVLAAADRLTVVCVVEAPPTATAGLESGFAGGLAPPEAVDAAWDEVDRAATAALDATAAALPPDVPVERRIERDDAGAALCRLAEELGADAVVVGSRGRGAIRRAVLGSVSAHVAHHAPCPVVVVPPSALG